MVLSCLPAPTVQPPTDPLASTLKMNLGNKTSSRYSSVLFACNLVELSEGFTSSSTLSCKNVVQVGCLVLRFEHILLLIQFIVSERFIGFAPHFVASDVGKLCRRGVMVLAPRRREYVFNCTLV
jgi:hypothetical protein